MAVKDFSAELYDLTKAIPVHIGINALSEKVFSILHDGLGLALGLGLGLG